MANKGGLLPSIYQQVEYLESTGTQFIDTGLIPSNNIGIDITFSSPNVSGSQYICGARNKNNGVEFAVGGSASNTYWALYFGGNAMLTTFNRANNNRIRVVISPRVDGVRNVSVTDLNTGVTTTNLSYVSINTTFNMLLFGYNGSSKNLGSSKIERFIAFTSDSVLRDYYSCYIKKSGEAGMYDKVNDEFNTNAGTGTFKKGGDI